MHLLTDLPATGHLGLSDLEFQMAFRPVTTESGESTEWVRLASGKSMPRPVWDGMLRRALAVAERASFYGAVAEYDWRPGWLRPEGGQR